MSKEKKQQQKFDLKKKCSKGFLFSNQKILLREHGLWISFLHNFVCDYCRIDSLSKKKYNNEKLLMKKNVQKVFSFYHLLKRYS